MILNKYFIYKILINTLLFFIERVIIYNFIDKYDRRFRLFQRFLYSNKDFLQNLKQIYFELKSFDKI